MHDVPYVQSDSVGPEVTAMMTAICVEVKRLLKPSPVGIQVLAGANKQAMAVAKAAGGCWAQVTATDRPQPHSCQPSRMFRNY